MHLAALVGLVTAGAAAFELGRGRGDRAAVGNWFQVRSTRYFEPYHAEAIWSCLFYLHTAAFILIAL